MPAYRCAFCNINYPPAVAFRVCPNCDEAIDYFTNVPPDLEWRKLIEMKRSGMDLPDRIPSSETDAATVVYRADSDTIMVADKQLRALGYMPEAFDVVKLNGTYYELLDFHSPSGFWTIERIDVYKWLELIDADTGEPFLGPSSDDIRQVDLGDGVKVYWDPRTGPDPRGTA